MRRLAIIACIMLLLFSSSAIAYDDSENNDFSFFGDLFSSMASVLTGKAVLDDGDTDISALGKNDKEKDDDNKSADPDKNKKEKENGDEEDESEDGDDSEGDDITDYNGPDKITICHRTGSEHNPYVILNVPPSAVDGKGKNDHSHHVADEHHKYGDIIPITDRNNDGLIDVEDCLYSDDEPYEDEETDDKENETDDLEDRSDDKNKSNAGKDDGSGDEEKDYKQDDKQKIICSPSVEVCNGLDDDCDGLIDEDLIRPCGCDCANTRVLLVLDDNNHGEDVQDFDYIYDILRELDVNVVKINEPSEGLASSDIDGYDLVWFSNPGWPMDDPKSIYTLQDFYDDGNPVVMQGDDMSWPRDLKKNDPSFTDKDLEDFLHLRFKNNGRDGNYDVEFSDLSHPLLTFLRGQSFVYQNDDIDTSRPLHGIDVLAWGTFQKDSKFNGPAIGVYDETEYGDGIILVSLLTISEIDPEWQAKTFIGNIVNWLLNKAGKCECGSDIGTCVMSTQTCSDGSWGECSGVPPINEICNGLDDDCDGEIDENLNCECNEGEEESCGFDLGACTSGKKVCSGGQWGDCMGSIGPSGEICDNVDNDCDGLVDEDLFEQCGSMNIGACSFGVKLCLEGQWSTCLNRTDPDIEVCNGLDDDCDGLVDEGLVQECGEDTGMCSTGTQSCVEGEWGECSGTYVGPSDEICNGIDDDCDGEIDNDAGCECENGAVRACGSDEGVCESGTQTCSFGKWDDCEGAIEPAEEICDNLDNDCDGLVDEELSRECGEYDLGLCSYGSQICENGDWGVCLGSVKPSIEICNAFDDDCDGSVDESLTEVCGITDTGACEFGIRSCSEGSWGICEGNIEPVDEICDDNIDNDCDGETDEECECTVPDKDSDGFNSIACGGDDCNDNNASINPDSSEICNGLDDDCDGSVDESLEKSCGSETGTCSQGIQTCSEGEWGSCIGGVEPVDEICNNLDDDCDGFVDEDLSQTCGSDIGECSKGTQTCSEGEWGECIDSIGPVNESCDSFDNDCDGLVDNGLVCNCQEGDSRNCGSNVGECISGSQICTDGEWGICEGNVEPSTELCDALDNDCNGLIDDEINSTCGTTDIGVCSYGFKVCSNGTWGECMGSIGPSDEICGDSLDNDCDGTVDESCGGGGGSGGGGGGRSSNRKTESPAAEMITKLLSGKSEFSDSVGFVPEPAAAGRCSKDDICVEGCVPSDPDCLITDLDLVIIDAPEVVDITDDKILVEAVVKNIGTVDLTGLSGDMDTVGKWKGSSFPIDPVSAGGNQNVIFELNSDICTEDLEQGDYNFDEKSVSARLVVKHNGKLMDAEKLVLPIVVPKFAVTTAKKDYSKSNILKTCFIVNNKNQDPKKQLEIEFEVYDRKNEILIDYLSPVIVGKDETLIKVKDYKIKHLPRKKDYLILASLYENGSVFAEGYRLNEAYSSVDLSKIIEQETGFEAFVARVKEYFAGLKSQK